MDSIDKKIIIIITAAVITTVTLYAILAVSGKSTESLDRDVIDRCRSLTREGADILVQVAKDNLKHTNPEDAQRLADFEARVADIEEEMSENRCRETQEMWAYGSFKQEMSEYEAYIAELARQNAEESAP